MLNALIDGIAALIFVGLPIGVCVLHWRTPGWFEHAGKIRISRVLGIFFLLSLCSWFFTALSMEISILSGNFPENGFSVFCAFALGWLYIWFFAIPIAFVYLVIRATLSLIQALRRCFQ